MKSEKLKKFLSSVLVTTNIVMPNVVHAEINQSAIKSISDNFVLTKTDDSKEIEVYLNGEKLEFDQNPIIVDGRTKVPFRKVFESMGCIVYYNNSEKKIMALTKEGKILTHVIGTNTIDFDGVTKSFDSISEILNDRTLIPLRAVAETLNSEVEWLGKENKVKITQKNITMDSILKEVMMCAMDDNYNPKDTKRYVDYKIKNPSMNIKQVIIDVNMDLDRELVPIKSTSIMEEYKNTYHYEPKEEDTEIAENPDYKLTLINKFNVLSDDYLRQNVEFLCNNVSDFGIHQSFYMAEDAIEPTKSLLNRLNEEGYLAKITYATPKYLETSDQFSSLLSASRWHPEIGGEEYAYKSFPQKNANILRTGYSFILNTSPDNEEIIREKINRGLVTDGDLISIGETMLKKLDKIAKTQEWMREHGHEYGFIERYPRGKEKYTKYEYVPNYYTYVGVEVATKMHNEGLCFEEYHAKYLNPTVNELEYSIDKTSTQKVLSNY